MPLPIVDEDAPRSGAAQARVFLSYAHEDAEYARRFVMHFQLLSRVLGRRDEDFFYDVARLAPGFRWSGTLHSFLDTTDVLVLLVSVNSLDSNSYCMTHEVLAAKVVVDEINLGFPYPPELEDQLGGGDGEEGTTE